MKHMIEFLETRRLLSVAIDPIAEQLYPANKSVIVPVTATTDSTEPVSYSVSTSDPRIEARVLNNVTFLRLRVSISGVDQGFMEFALFDDIAPETVQRITDLVNSGFYTGLTFHRIIPGFMAQGGDPAGTGTGGTGQKFDDEFHPEAIFSGRGQLAMANSGSDTNDSQFFVTVDEQHHLNYRHTIFGQLVRGWDVLENIMAVGSTNGAVSQQVRITVARTLENRGDAVVLVKGPLNVPGTVTVTATDHNSTSSRTFNVNGRTVTDSLGQPVNDPPFLLPIGDQQTIAGLPITLQIRAMDVEGDSLVVDGITLNEQQLQVTRNGDILTVTPAPGFVGTSTVLVGVNRGPNDWDTQEISVQVWPGPFAQYNAATQTLAVNATSMNDTVTLTTDGTLIYATLNGQSLSFGLHAVQVITVFLGDGDDHLTVGDGVPAISADGGNGNDYIFGGQGNDTILGGEGDDTLHGGEGNDYIHGGPGHDLIGGQAGWDTLIGGRGRDTIRGGNHADLIYGGNGGDVIYGGKGMDTIFGENGNDYLDGEDGADWIYGGDGDDTIVGGTKVDHLYGNAGNDIIYSADDVQDFVYGGIDDDTVYADLLDVVAGAETLIRS